MFDRKKAKSILQGIDFGKLEATAMALMNNGKSISVLSEHENSIYAFTDFIKDVNGTRSGRIWADDLYFVAPEPHLKSKVDHLINDFWANPGIGHMYLYLAQLEKNPVTRDLFKSESTTHHFPWYRMGSKY